MIQRWRNVGVMVADNEHGWWVRLDDHERVVAEVRAAALCDAVEAVKAADLYTHYRVECEPTYGTPMYQEYTYEKHRKCDLVDDAVAAIEALGGAR